MSCYMEGRLMGVQVRMMKEERGRVEGALEEARSREVEQRSRADALKQELEVQRTQAQRHLTQVHIAPPPSSPLSGQTHPPAKSPPPYPLICLL